MIKIITVYNSLNPGSYLQATALYRVLEDKYEQVAFFNTKSRYPVLSSFKKFLKLVFKLKIRFAINQLLMSFKYIKCLRRYELNNKIIKNDIYIIGSDEIWNVSRDSMRRYRIFWGEGLNKNNCISYAPSINDATLDDFKNLIFVEDSLEHFHAISVRDNYSKFILNKISDRDIQVVCDPTLLLNVNTYRSMYNKENCLSNYIFIYGLPESFSQEEIDSIIKFAKDNNKKIISYYHYHDFCDFTYYGDPTEFLMLIDNADYVFTSTFHGTMFSIIYNKRFVVFGDSEKNIKVKEVTDQFGLNVDYRKIKNIKKILDASNYDYKGINSLLNKYRQQGLDYLYHSIDDIIK